MNKKRKIIALALTAAMLVSSSSALSLTSYAEETYGPVKDETGAVSYQNKSEKDVVVLSATYTDGKALDKVEIKTVKKGESVKYTAAEKEQKIMVLEDLKSIKPLYKAVTVDKAPESTPASTPEATPASTPEATPVSTPEATPVSTPEATPVSTPEATPVSTPEATPASTPEATATPIVLKPVAATYIDQSNPTKDNSSQTTLKTGYNKISNGNVGFAKTDWNANYATIMKFDVSDQLNEGETITKAILSYKATADSKRGRNHIIGSTTKKDWDSTVTYEGLDSSIPFTQIGDGHTINKGSTITITQDITEYAKSQEDNIYALCVIDTAAGGSDIDKNSISLEIEKLDPSTQIKVSYVVEGVTTDEIVEKGNTPKNIPTPEKLGYNFDGWKVNDTEEILTSEEVAEKIFENATILTAQFSFNTSYVQSIAKVEFIDPKKEAIKYPTESGAFERIPYTVKVTSDIGDDITSDCTVEWSIAGESDDGYVMLDDEEENKTSATRNLRIRQGGEGCYGYIKATVTYTKNDKDEPQSVQIPYAVVTDSKPANQILPAAGYPISMDLYKDNMVGYKATADDLTTGYDIVLNNWCIVGSLPKRDLYLDKCEDGKKALVFSNTTGNRGGTGSSCVATMAFPVQTSQYVLETVVKFDGTSRIGVWDKTPNNGNPSAEWSISYSSGKLTAGNNEIEGVTQNEWYKLVISSDPTTGIYSVYVYDMTDKLVGSATDIEGAKITEKYLCIDAGFPIYINSLKAYTPTVDSIVINSESDVIQVPENVNDAPNELSLSALCKSSDGIKLTGAVEWSLAEEYQGVEIVKNTQTATLKVSNGASGDIIVNASMGGKNVSKTITLTNSSDVVAFSSKKGSITIPFSGANAEIVTYTAETRLKDGGVKDNDTITYSFLDKTGSAVLENLPSGITSETKDGSLVLTVADGATPVIFYIKATNSEGLSTKVQVNVHGLSYSFGTTEIEGYTQVTADTLYNDTTGYGFETTTGLTDAEENVSGTNTYKFKAKVPNGNYDVEVTTTSKNIFSEIVDDAVKAGANVTGISKTGNKFSVAVCDEILDLTFDADSNISKLSIAQSKAKTKNEKPAIYAIGDSTTNNSADGGCSWGNCAANGTAKRPDIFSSFSNNGQAGRDSVNFYNQGRVETVLLNICPGDYVTINMGINSRPENGNEAAAYPILMKKYYAQAVLDRGAIPVIVTATPDGPVVDDKGSLAANYNASTGKFTNNRGTGARNGTLRKIAQELNLNIIELGYDGETWLNTLDADYLAQYNADNNTSYTTILEMVQSWYVDHNHYKAPMGNWIAEHIFACLEKIENGSTEFNQENDPHINEQ